MAAPIFRSLPVCIVGGGVAHRLQLKAGPLGQRLDSIPARIELAQKYLASLGLIHFANLIGRAGQTGQGTEETTIGFVLPSNVPAATPTALS